MNDDYLTFERDINYHKEKLYNLYQEQNQLTKELSKLQEKIETLNNAMHKQEIQEITLLGEINQQSPYILGDKDEIIYLAEKIKQDLPISYTWHMNTTHNNQDNHH